MKLNILLLLCILSLVLLQPITCRIRDGECEVCLKLVDEFKFASNTYHDNNELAIESRIKSICNIKTDLNEKRFCYYIGGSNDAATYLLGTISKPIMNYLPAVKICDKLKSMDPEICKIKYTTDNQTAVDYSKVDFSSMRVRELKDVLKRWGEQCINCLDKDDYLTTIKSVLPKYVKDKVHQAAEKVDEL